MKNVIHSLCFLIIFYHSIFMMNLCKIYLKNKIKNKLLIKNIIMIIYKITKKIHDARHKFRVNFGRQSGAFQLPNPP